MLLPALPCADVEECTSTAAAPATHNEHEEEGCNPFCTCSCCGSITTAAIPLLKTTTAKPAAIQKKQFAYSNNFRSVNFACKIWQPPKMV